LLVASGESMINADIKDGDLVLIRKQNTFENGQIAVVLTESDCSDESMATLKRVYRDDKNKRFRLHPENDNMKDFYVEQIDVIGIAVKVIKDVI